MIKPHQTHSRAGKPDADRFCIISVLRVFRLVWLTKSKKCENIWFTNPKKSETCNELQSTSTLLGISAIPR